MTNTAGGRGINKITLRTLKIFYVYLLWERERKIENREREWRGGAEREREWRERIERILG